MANPRHVALAPSSDKTEPMERLSKAEIRKDALQETVQSVASTVGEVASIITTAVKDVAGAIGGLATDVFEIRDGARRASEHAEEE
jgi:phytoene/squalene synthetase